MGHHEGDIRPGTNSETQNVSNQNRTIQQTA